MKKITYLLLFFSIHVFSQDITFNDPDLLTYLTTKLCVDTDGDNVFDSTADFNQDGQIQLSEAAQVTRFKFSTQAYFIQSLEGFENFTNLILLDVSTLEVNSLDLSIWQYLQTLKISTTHINSFNFNNPQLTHFELQNVGFSNPLFDLTNLPNLEYVRIQSYSLMDNLIFGTHNNLEELRILAGSYTSLNLSGMPALKYLTIADFTGNSIDISSNTLLEEFIFRYTDSLTTIEGSNASPYLEKVIFNQDDTQIPSNLDLSFNNQALKEIFISGVNSFSLSNNNSDIGDAELFFINESINITNCNFSYVDTSLNAKLRINHINTDALSLTNLEGLKFLVIGDFTTALPFDLSTVFTESIILTSCSLTELNLKNGNILQQFISEYDTDIQFICVDSDERVVVENGYENENSQVVVHPYCTFVLGGDYYELTGNIFVDLGNGCLPYTVSPIFDVRFTVTDNANSDIFYTNNLNRYFYTLPEGNHFLNSQLVENDYWTITPSSIELSFPSNPSPYFQDFCITPNGVYDDLEIIIVPLTPAVAGFDADYKIIYKNKGNTELSGSIEFTFNENYMSFLSSIPIFDEESTGNLIWNYTNLQPFETGEIYVSMALNTPIDADFPLNSGDYLNYTAIINPFESDETPDDNTTSFNQEVVNSFDPNDKTCLEGATITPDQVGKYVHYLIRFENTGNSNAENIVVRDSIDNAKFDIATLVPINASHDFYTRINNGNEVEFIFENIQLPFEENSNDGYVLFKIKTLESMEVNDTFSNQAQIYFDYNAPIVTNTAVTTVETLGVEDINNHAKTIVHPNPVKDNLKIQIDTEISSIEIYDTQGKLVKVLSANESNSYNVESLPKGIYIVKIMTIENLPINSKFIKE